MKSIYHDDKFVKTLVKSVNDPEIIDPKNTKIAVKFMVWTRKKSRKRLFIDMQCNGDFSLF